MKFKVKVLFCFLVLYVITLADAHIFVYHRFDDTRYKTSNILGSKLRKDFQYLKDNGYIVVELEKILEKIQEKEDIPDNWVALTIDDAYETFYENGLEIFKEFKYPFTLFVNTEAVNDKYGDFLSWEQIEEISKFGTIGSHSHSHPHSTKISAEELKQDLEKAKELFSEKYSKKVEYYTHPYSEYNKSVIEIVKECGYTAIFNQTSGAVSSASNIYDLNRIAIGNDDNINYWLKIKYLEADWIDLEVKDNVFRNLKLEVSKEIKMLEIYVSGYGWQWYDVEDGVLEVDLDKKVKFNVSRIIVKSKDNKWSSYTFVK